MRASACSLIIFAISFFCVSTGNVPEVIGTCPQGTRSSSFIQTIAWKTSTRLEEEGPERVAEEQQKDIVLAAKGDGKDKCREKGAPDNDCCAKKGEASCADGYVLQWTGTHCYSHRRWGTYSYYRCVPPTTMTEPEAGLDKCLEKGAPDHDCCAKKGEASCADGHVLQWTGTHCYSHRRWGTYSYYRCHPPATTVPEGESPTTTEPEPESEPTTTEPEGESPTTAIAEPESEPTTTKPEGEPPTTTTAPSQSKSYQPAIPPAGTTPAEFWTGGFIQQLLGRQCPPWTLPPFTETAMTPGHGGCKRDSINLAVRYIRPSNRCSPGGRCTRGGQYGSCVNYNKGKWYPEYNQAGFCITTGPQGGGKHQLAYVEKTLANNPGVGKFYVNAIKWAQTDSPARYSCDSFCKKCDRSSEYCPDTADSPIAAGDPGSCDCHCRSGVAAADFDRCTTVSAAVCSKHVYCGANGKAIFTPIGGEDKGSCTCECDHGYSGRNCELRKGEPCNINDCNHRTHGGDLGTRPHCACNCGSGKFNFAGPTCEDWTFGRNPGGKYSSTSSNFTVQRQTQGRCWGGCKPPGQLGEECLCTVNGNWCRRFYSGKNGCVGDSNVVLGPEALTKNSEGLACLKEKGGGKYRCQRVEAENA